MAYRRNTIVATQTVTVELIELLEMGERWSPDYESNAYKLVMPLHGYVFARTSRGNDVVDFTSALVLTPNASYRMRQPVAQSSLVLTVRDETFGESLNVRSKESRCASVDPRCTARLHRASVTHNDELAAEELLLSATDSVFRATHMRDGNVEKSATDRAQRASLRAREYLAEHFREKLSLSQISNAVAASPFHLSRSFRSRYGTTLFAQREKLRIAAALRLMTKAKTDLTTLALELGYSSHSHFSAAFRRAIGCAPSHWNVR
jgi:AraC family transcriptional regulator